VFLNKKQVMVMMMMNVSCHTASLQKPT